MRGKVAKAIRRAVYGDMSPRLREYRTIGSGQIVCTGLRLVYKHGKAMHKARKFTTQQR